LSNYEDHNNISCKERRRRRQRRRCFERWDETKLRTERKMRQTHNAMYLLMPRQRVS